MSVRYGAGVRRFSHLTWLVWLVHRRYVSDHCFVWVAGLIDVFLFGLAGRVIELCICLGLLGYTLVWVCCLGAVLDEFCFWMFYVQFMDSVFLLLFCSFMVL